MAYNMLDQLGDIGPVDTGVDLQGALRQNQLAQQQAAAKPKGGFFRPGGTFSNVLGAIGDALLVHSGRQAVYGPMMAQQRQKREMGAALSNYLGQADPALAALMEADPETAMQAYRIKNQQPEVPGIIREANAYNALPDEQRASVDRYLKLRFPQQYAPGAPVTLGPNDTLELPGADAGGDGLPTVSTPEEARQLPPGTQFRMPDGRIGTVPGGPSASPTGGFLN